MPTTGRSLPRRRVLDALLVLVAFGLVAAVVLDLVPTLSATHFAAR
jgi:hypothetical protein